MTRKDYVAVARIIKDIRRFHSTYDTLGHAIVPVNVFEDDMAALFAADNDRFDRERFLKACGR